jgi:very-short-patch-repair endonuclease
MRAQPTAEEELLWQRLRRNAIGYHFRRQQVIAGFIVDFYCHQAKLVVEIDGPIHGSQQDQDLARDDVLQNMGLHILRLPAATVRENLATVLQTIATACARS